MNHFFYNMCKIIAWLFTKSFGRLTVIGRERIPASGAIIAANHSSYIDPILLGVAIPHPIWFMAKAELFENRLFGSLIRHLHAFPVRRGVADRQALRRAHEVLTSGKQLIVFFEGKRSNDGKLLPAEPGTAMIALRAGVPIVPTAVINADRLLPRGSIFLHFSRTKVVFGEPIMPEEGESGREAIDRISTELMTRIAALMQEHGAPERVPEHYLSARVEGAACE